MAKVVLISGSNRNRNTEYILKQITASLEDSEILFLRKKKIEYCKGCLACHQLHQCMIDDEMEQIIEKLTKADFILFGVPNYFDNVSGLFKNFIDRLHPCYKSENLRGKKVGFIFVGGGKEEGTKETLHQAIQGLVKYLSLDIQCEYSFKALQVEDMKKQQDKISEIIEEIKNIISKI